MRSECVGSTVAVPSLEQYNRRACRELLMRALPDRRLLLPTLSAILLIAHGAVRAEDDPSSKKPSLSLRATPAVAFAPAKIRLSAEIKGGANDFEDLYCPAVEWEWGDGTTSSAEADCEPYVAGQSTIRRRYSVEHIYRQPGAYRIALRLKKGTRVNGFAQATIQVRAGLP